MSEDAEDSNLRNATYFRGQTYDFTIEHGTMPSKRRPNIDAGERALGHFILPPFQRPQVWSSEQQVRFIESIWLRLPIPTYVYNLTHGVNGKEVDYWLIDGQQRWTSVLEFMDDRFPVMGYHWSQVSKIDKRFFENRPWPCVRTEYDDPKLLREVYDRLAYGGTAHDPADREIPAAVPSMR